MATPLRGWALAASGHGEEGITQIHQGLAGYRATGATRARPYYLALLAEASAQVGKTSAGLETLAEALATLAKSGVLWWEAELYRLKGELLLGAGGQGLGVGAQQSVNTDACFRQALEVARRQQAKSLELRTAMSLARLWQRQGKRTDARDLLAPIYGWFTEGFDTADPLFRDRRGRAAVMSGADTPWRASEEPRRVDVGGRAYPGRAGSPGGVRRPRWRAQDHHRPVCRHQWNR
jgi:predicted ATPase